MTGIAELCQRSSRRAVFDWNCERHVGRLGKVSRSNSTASEPSRKSSALHRPAERSRQFGDPCHECGFAKRTSFTTA